MRDSDDFDGEASMRINGPSHGVNSHRKLRSPIPGRDNNPGLLLNNIKNKVP
jgi:hypothetical protein